MADPAYIVDGVLTDGEAWVAIASTTVAGSDATSVTFTSTDDGQVGDFSQYMDLVVIAYLRGAYASTTDTYRIRLNTDYTESYNFQYLQGTGSAVQASASSEYSIIGAKVMVANSATANIFGCCITYLSDINSGKYTSALSIAASDLDGSVDGRVGITAANYEKQAPITALWCDFNNGDVLIGSRFDVFGILPRMVA